MARLAASFYWPSSFSHTVIWVVCDRLSKSAHFIALPTSFTTTQLANRFSVEICRLHGVANSIIFDRDPLFLSYFWKQLFHVQGTKVVSQVTIRGHGTSTYTLPSFGIILPTTPPLIPLLFKHCMGDLHLPYQITFWAQQQNQLSPPP